MRSKRLFGSSEENLCRGGASWGCAKVIEFSRDENGDVIREKDVRTLRPHRPVNGVNCRLCKTYMGCKVCAERIADLICLRCHDWATIEALRRHGPMVRDREAQQEAWKIVRMTFEGRIGPQDSDKLFEELFRRGR